MEDDDVADFFDFSKPFKRTVVSGGYINGAVKPQKLNIQTLPERAHQGTEYAEKFCREEEARLMEVSTTMRRRGMDSNAMANLRFSLVSQGLG